MVWELEGMRAIDSAFPSHPFDFRYVGLLRFAASIPKKCLPSSSLESHSIALYALFAALIPFLFFNLVGRRLVA